MKSQMAAWNCLYLLLLLCSKKAWGWQHSLITSRRKALFQGASMCCTATILSYPRAAHAERSLGTVTESYKRYIPRMEAGFEFLNNDLRTMIERGDVDGVLAELKADKGTKISAMKGTMKIFATAFSDSVLSQATRELQLAEYKTEGELNKIVDNVATSKELALDALGQAVFFAQIYSEIANANIPRSLPKIKGPQGVGERLPDRATVQNQGAF